MNSEVELIPTFLARNVPRVCLETSSALLPKTNRFQFSPLALLWGLGMFARVNLAPLHPRSHPGLRRLSEARYSDSIYWNVADIRDRRLCPWLAEGSQNYVRFGTWGRLSFPPRTRSDQKCHVVVVVTVRALS